MGPVVAVSEEKIQRHISNKGRTKRTNGQTNETSIHIHIHTSIRYQLLLSTTIMICDGLNIDINTVHGIMDTIIYYISESSSLISSSSLSSVLFRKRTHKEKKN